uniref:Uncharacterized protein n=1 Tax=Panagrolaimus davidi TaxID=227884 RepID=A0A914Q5C3_9BILA
MAYLDKPIKFKNLQASSADYHFRMYKTRDEDNMHMIELCDEKDIEFIYRLRLTTKELDKIYGENESIPTDLIGYIQKFVKELSEEKWLTCETNAEGCNIVFYRIYKDLGYQVIKPVLKLSLLSVKGEELHQHFKYTALKYMKRYDDKKRESEEKKKKAEDYEKKIRQLEAEVKEKIKLKKNYEILDFDFKRLKADYKSREEYIAELLEDNEDLKREFELTKNEADQLAEERDKFKAENEDLQNKNKKLREEIQELEDENESLDIECKTMKKAIDEIADKGRKYETKIEELMNQLDEYEKELKKLLKQKKEIVKESSLKDNLISDLKIEIGTLKFTVENQGKIIEEINGNQKLAVPNKNAQPSIKQPRSNPWVLGNASLPNR